MKKKIKKAFENNYIILVKEMYTANSRISNKVFNNPNHDAWIDIDGPIIIGIEKSNTKEKAIKNFSETNGLDSKTLTAYKIEEGV